MIFVGERRTGERRTSFSARSDAPSNRLMRPVHWLYTRRLVPLLGRFLSLGSAYRYLAESIDHFPPAPRVLDSMRQAGFEDAACRPLSGGVVTLFAARKPGERR